MAYTGKWIFNDEKDKFEFRKSCRIEDKNAKLRPLTPIENEVLKTTHKSYENTGPITMDSIKKEVEKLADKTNKRAFRELSENVQINTFLKYLIIYIDQFLKTVEFLLIRRDIELESPCKIKDLKSIEIEQKVSDMLSNKRLLLAREFSRISLGQIYISKYFKNKNKNGVLEFESFLQFCAFFLFIALHRRGLNTIRYEVERLFRSPHFTKKPKSKDMPKYTLREQQILFGRSNPKEKCYYFANSPLIAEIIKMNRQIKELLWIGDIKYMGPSEYMSTLEKPYITSDTQLNLIDCSIGVLGHPKALYDSQLNQNMRKIRQEGFDEKYDVYGLIRRDLVSIPKGKLSLTRNRSDIPGLQMKRKEL